MEKNHSLLKNKVYLYLLAFFNKEKMPSYTELGQRIGVTRQTVSTKVKDLIKKENIKINKDDIVEVKNTLDLDVDKLRKILITKPTVTPVELEQILFYNIDKNQILKNLDISNGNYWDSLKSEVVVYGIISEGVLKYVGCTKQYQVRIKQHMNKRPFLKIDNFVILKKVEENTQFDYERQLLHLLQPEWNIYK